MAHGHWQGGKDRAVGAETQSEEMQERKQEGYLAELIEMEGSEGEVRWPLVRDCIKEILCSYQKPDGPARGCCHSPSGVPWRVVYVDSVAQMRSAYIKSAPESSRPDDVDEVWPTITDRYALTGLQPAA